MMISFFLLFGRFVFGAFGCFAFFFCHLKSSGSPPGTTRSVGPPLDGCSKRCDSAMIAAFDSRTRATSSSTLSRTTYLVPSTR